MYLGSYKGNITGLRKIARELLPDVAIEDLAIMSDDGLSIKLWQEGWRTVIEHDDYEVVYFIRKEELNNLPRTSR